MPTFPGATTIGATRAPLSYVRGYPFRIVHHSTEGSTLAGAVSAYRSHGGWPHFTVDDSTIAQHIDTGTASFALKNAPGGIETNRARAIQIEVVGFAARPKNLKTLANVARLCRWLEATHGIPRQWPNGYPKVAVNGRDPGGHNRSPEGWRLGGHFAHSTTPENFHWDPAYTLGEIRLVMAAPEPVPDPPPQPPQLPPEEYDMGIIAWSPDSAYYIDGGVKVALDPDSLAALRTAGAKEVVAGGLVARTPEARYP